MAARFALAGARAIVAATVVALFLLHPTLSGATYGGFVLAVMFGIVVPMGHASQPAMSAANFWNTLIAHVLFFGVPVAWTVTKVTTRARTAL